MHLRLTSFIFKESLEMVKEEANSLFLDADLMARNEASCCFSCGYSNSVHTLNRFVNCKLAKYCSKVSFNRFFLEFFYLY